MPNNIYQEKYIIQVIMIKQQDQHDQFLIFFYGLLLIVFNLKKTQTVFCLFLPHPDTKLSDSCCVRFVLTSSTTLWDWFNEKSFQKFWVLHEKPKNEIRPSHGISLNSQPKLTIPSGLCSDYCPLQKPYGMRT